MPAAELAANLDPANLIGNVSIPRSTEPSLRGVVRRSDPDGFSSVPYFVGLSGKKLDIEYTDAVFAVQTATITFPSNSYSQALTTIAAVDPANIGSLDADGFVTVKQLNSGDRHYLKILPQAVPADEAADLLGFIVDPYPGSISYAGELASAPPTRTQSNPQGTALLARDEDLSTTAINRAFVSVLHALDRARWDLEKDALVVHEVFVTTQSHPVSGTRGFFVNDATIRLPVTTNTSVVGPVSGTPLDSYFELTTSSGFDNEQLFNSSGTKLTVLRVHHSDLLGPINTNNPMASWPSSDGYVVHDYGTAVVEKHGSITIDSIRGNVLYCPGATFVTNLIQKNDPIVISGATNTTPFSHNGVFAVLEVLDEEHVSVRPLGVEEASNWTAPLDGARPSELNSTGTGFGDVTIYFGSYVPCSNMFFTLSYDPGNGVSLRLRLMMGKPLRKTFISTAQSFRGHGGAIMRALLDHINDPTDAHSASAISGFSSSTFWKDGSSIFGSNLRATVEDILTDLGSSTSTVDSGAYRVGAPAVSTTGANQQLSLTSGSDGSQLLELLTKIRDHQIDTKYHDSTGHVSGLTLGTYSFPNLPVNAGVIVAQYLGEMKVYNVGATSFSLVGNQLYYIYVDLTDGVTKITQTATTAFSSTAFPLWYLFTQGFGITWTQDLRRNLSSNYKKGFVTVGGTGSDFSQLEAALEWVRWSRQTGDLRTWEVLVQGDITMQVSASITHPIVIRGTAPDGSALQGGPKAIVRTKDGSPAFSFSAGADNTFQIRDLYFKMSTLVSGSTLLNNPGGGDDCVFSNCIFDGGCFSGGTNLITNWASGTAMRGWLFDHCTFKNAVCASGTNYYMKLGFNCDGVTIRKCRFSGSTANANLGGVWVDFGNDYTIEDCYFDIGGKHVTITDSQPSYQCYRNVVRNNRCFNSRGIALEFSAKGDAIFESNWVHNCAVANGPAISMINIGTTGVGGGGIARDNKVTDWQNGAAITIAGGQTMRMRAERNVCRTSAGYTAANVGISVGVQSYFAVVSHNEIDLSFEAASNAGKPGGIGINTGASGFQGRVSDNQISNCGSTASPGYGIVLRSSYICSGNIFYNCRGSLIYDQEGNCIIYGNQGSLNGSLSTDIAINLISENSLVVGNRVTGALPGAPISSLPSSFGHNVIMANRTPNAGPVPTNGGVGGSLVRNAYSVNIGSKNVAAATTVVHAAVPMPSNAYGVQLPQQVTLPPKVNNLEPGVRITYQNGTYSETFNTLGTQLFVRFDDDNIAVKYPANHVYHNLVHGFAVAKIEIVVRNPSGGPDTQSLSGWWYYGFMVG